MIDLKSFCYYFRWYPFLSNEESVQWWYNRQTGEVLHRDSFEANHTLEQQSAFEEGWPDWVPISKVDVVALERQFLQDIGLGKKAAQIERVSGCDFDVAFRQYVDYHHLFEMWHRFEAAHLQEEARVWCKTYGIRCKRD